MAISRLGTSTGTFAPAAMTFVKEDRSGVEKTSRGHTIHRIDLKFCKINETEYVKWCRRNLGERHSDWDFWLAGGILYIEVRSDKAKFAYEMWKL